MKGFIATVAALVLIFGFFYLMLLGPKNVYYAVETINTVTSGSSSEKTGSAPTVEPFNPYKPYTVISREDGTQGIYRDGKPLGIIEFKHGRYVLYTAKGQSIPTSITYGKDDTLKAIYYLEWAVNNQGR